LERLKRWLDAVLARHRRPAGGVVLAPPCRGRAALHRAAL